MNSYIAWKNHILKGKPEKHRAYKKYSVREARLALIEIWAKLAMRHYKAPQPHAKKRRRLVLFVHKTVGIKSYYWAQSEFHTAGFKAPWWAHTTTMQVGAKMRNMRWTYQVALLGLYWGYWWYISSLPYERAAMQHEASSNSLGDLTQFVCKISFPKKVVSSMNKNWWPIIEMFYVLFEFKFLLPHLYCTESVILFSGARRAPIQI